MKKFKFEDICWPLKLCLRFFAEQSLHCSIILRGKERSLRDFAGQRTKALWFRGAKSALLHNFARKSLHCFIILRGKDMDFRAKIQQQMRFSYFFKKYFNLWHLIQISIGPWWSLFRKKIYCRTAPLKVKRFTRLENLAWSHSVFIQLSFCRQRRFMNPYCLVLKVVIYST